MTTPITKNEAFASVVTPRSAAECEICRRRKSEHTEEEGNLCWIRRQRKEQLQSLLDTARRADKVSTGFGRNTFEAARSDWVERNPQAWKDAAVWPSSKFRSAYIWGPQGTGKTYLARSIGYRCMEQFDSSVVETTSYDMLNGAAQFDNRAFMRDLKCSDIVIVDDIDKAHWTHKELYFLWGLTNSLCENGGRMIITSNLAPANFRAYFAEASAGNESLIEAIVQRLEKMQVIHVDGESLRGLDTEKRAPRRQR